MNAMRTKAPSGELLFNRGYIVSMGPLVRIEIEIPEGEDCLLPSDAYPNPHIHVLDRTQSNGKQSKSGG